MNTIQEMLETAVRQLGKPREEITVIIEGEQCNSTGRRRRHREIIVKLKGQKAQDFQAHPTLDAIWQAYGAWLGDGVSDDGKQAIRLCCKNNADPVHLDLFR